jgi:hypothetical protein
MDVGQTLYDWWLERFEHHECEARATRQLLGYADTELCPKRLTKAEFIERLRRPGRDPVVKQHWLNRIVAGHESEVVRLPRQVQAFLQDCRTHPPTFLDRSHANELKEAS